MAEFAKVFEQAANESLEKWNPEIDCLSLSSSDPSGMNHFEILFCLSHRASWRWHMLPKGDGTLSRVLAEQRTEDTGLSADAARTWVMSSELVAEFSAARFEGVLA